jgi:hypothetical protein
MPEPARPQWLIFAAQVLLVAMVELGDDMIRGNISRPNTSEALRHARDVIHFEAGHGFFLEPSLQSAVLRTYHLMSLEIPSTLTVSVLNGIYAFCHVFVTLLVAAWVFRWHRPRFAMLRDVMLLTTFVALCGYELYPLAPPRLSTGVLVDGRMVAFHDTVRSFLGTGRLTFASIGYNPYSAMPSLHVAWAIVVGGTLVLLARRRVLRVFGLVYPLIVTFDVIVTGNHYVLDALGALVAVVIATLLALPIERWRQLRRARVQEGDAAG